MVRVAGTVSFCARLCVTLDESRLTARCFSEFESLLATMYLATLMLTGQGGPEGHLPWYTKGVVLLTGAFSIGLFAIPGK